MEKYELQPLRDLPIEEVADRLGLEVRQHKALCPFHNDHHPSLSFNTRRNTYRCFVCDAHGGTIDLVMHLLHKDFKEACSWLSNGSYETPTIIYNLSSINSTPSFDASKYEKFFDHPYLSPAAKAFLFDQRRLDPRVVRWCRLTSWRDRQGTHWLQIPYYDPDGHLIGLQNRNLNYQKAEGQNSSFITHHSSLEPHRPDAEGPLSHSATQSLSHSATQSLSHSAPRFKFPKGSQCHIYNLPILNLLRPHEPLYIAEGPSDCWALLSSGLKAIAIPSATLLSHNDLHQLLSINYNLSTEFHMYPDHDLPGERLFLQLQNLLPNLTHHHLPPTCKDYSDYYVKVKN